jgi:Rrf2 family protein
MQITHQADYATRAILYLAQREKGKHIATGKVAKEQKIPSSFLAKIVSQLSIAGILQTSRGAHGGIWLARDPEDITLLEVVEAIDGPIRLNVCSDSSGECTLEDDCPMHPVWCEAQDQLITKLKSTNFTQLASKSPSNQTV